MKKRSKKLTLSRETLAELGGKTLENAAGASGKPVCCTITASCPPPLASADGGDTCLC
ncbi:MAG TPA: hypothetical protein VIJ61_15085 [Thermoanaerobaculia bacterium]